MIVSLFTFKTQYTSLIIGPFICSFISTSNYVHLNEPSWSHLKLRIILLHMLTRSERLITIRIKYYIGCHYERGLYHCLYKNILISKYIIHTVLDTFFVVTMKPPWHCGMAPDPSEISASTTSKYY